MAFSGDDIQYKRWDMFHYYDASVALNSTIGISTSLMFSVVWKLAELRLHFSTALVSDITFTARMSSAKNSSINTRLISQQLSNAQDYILQYDENPLLFFSNDTLIMTTSTISVTNLVGLEAIGWAVRG